MYKAFFGLTKNPFGMSPDTEFLFVTPRHREALAGLTYAITQRKGFLALTGPAGTGKTTVLTWVLERMSDCVATSVIQNPVLTSQEFLEMVLLGFGISEIPDSKPRRLRKLEDFLITANESAKVSALIVDEAHKLTPELLEEIRLLGNFERHGTRLLQILLIGQKELDDLLNRPDLGQLKQRICVWLTIGPLDRLALESYVQHRWNKAGGHTAPFPPQTLDSLLGWSGGIPRLVNALCDNALMLAYAENRPVVHSEHIDSVARDLRLAGVIATQPLLPAAPVSSEVKVPSEAPVAVRNVNPENDKTLEVPARPFRITTLERYAPQPKAASFFNRWAARLGLA